MVWSKLYVCLGFLITAETISRFGNSDSVCGHIKWFSGSNFRSNYRSAPQNGHFQDHILTDVTVECDLLLAQ